MRRPEPECRDTTPEAQSLLRSYGDWDRPRPFRERPPAGPSTNVRGACYYSGMAFGRSKAKTADSTTVVPEVPEAGNPAASVVKPARTRRKSSKPTPPPAPAHEPAPALAEPEEPAEIAAQVRSIPTHDDEW